MTAREKTRAITLVKHIRVEQKVCPQCGKLFEGVKVAKFCSKNCANTASYARNAEQYRANRRERYHAEKRIAKSLRKAK